MKRHLLAVSLLVPVVLALSACTAAPSPTAAPPTAPPTETFTPLPSATSTSTATVPPTVTNTIPPSATPTEEGVLFQDDFGDDCKLTASKDFYALSTCDKGEYVVSILQEKTDFWIAYKKQDLDNFVFESDAHVISSDGYVDYGVGFRTSGDLLNYYTFLISNDGQFSVHRVIQGTWRPLISWTRSQSVKWTGVNHLKVVATGEQMAFYVNGEWLNTISDSNFSHGSIGIYTYSSNAGTRVEFSNVRVSKVQQSFKLPKGIPTRIPSVSPTRPPVANTAAPVVPTAVAKIDMPANFFDSFDSLGILPPFKDEICSASYEGGQYHVRVTKQNYMCWSIYPRSYINFVLKVDITMLTGEAACGGGADLIFGYKDRDNFYDFSVDRLCRGYVLVKESDGQWSEIHPFDAGLHVGNPPQPDATAVHIKIVVSGSQIAMYSGNVLMDKSNDPLYQGGRVGVSAGAFGQDSHVSFDNFKIDSLP